MRATYRVLAAAALAAAVAGCAVAYRTGIVRKDILSDAQQVVADARFNHGDMTIRAAADRADTTYAPGEPITLSVTTSKNAYVAILRVLASGETTIVFPNRERRSAAIAAGTTLTVPGPHDAVKITAGKPGVVLFEFIASTTTVDNVWVFTRAPDKGADFADLGVTTRNIVKDLLAALKVGAGHDTAATYLTVRISGGGAL